MNDNLSNKSKNFAILLCAGTSQRIGKFDKTISQFNGKPLFLHSLQKLISNNYIDEVIVVVSKKNKEITQRDKKKNSNR